MTGKEMVEMHARLRNAAFPFIVDVDGIPGYVTGLSKREYAEIHILAGLLASGKFAELTSEGHIVGRDVAIELAKNYAERLVEVKK